MAARNIFNIIHLSNIICSLMDSGLNTEKVNYGFFINVIMCNQGILYIYLRNVKIKVKAWRLCDPRILVYYQTLPSKCQLSGR